MVKVTKICLVKTFLRPVAAVMAVAGLFYLSPATASAATYQDVQNFLNNNPAPSECINWVEEVGSGYKVWRRCAADNVLAHTNTYIYSVGSEIKIGTVVHAH